MGSLSILQGIFPTQGSNPGLSHCRRILYQLSHKGSPFADTGYLACPEPQAKTRAGRLCPAVHLALYPTPPLTFTPHLSPAGGSGVQSLIHVRLFATPWIAQPSRPLCPWDCPGKNTGGGCHFLFQGIFPTQGLNPSLLYCRRIVYHWATWEPHHQHWFPNVYKLASDGKDFRLTEATELQPDQSKTFYMSLVAILPITLLSFSMHSKIYCD